MSRFCDMLLVERGLSAHTVSAYASDINQFARWLAHRGTSLIDVSRADVLSWLAVRVSDGASARSAARQLSALRSFYAYLKACGAVAELPTADVASPQVGRPLPTVLSESDVSLLLVTPDTTTELGLRDRAMLELLYGCGLRVGELVTLEQKQVNSRQGALRVFGKGNRERLVPMGEAAMHWLERYLLQARPAMASPSTDTLFVSRRGQTLTRQAVWHRIRAHAGTAGIRRDVSPHTLRHAFATHLVNHDADLRVVQLLLGHSNLTTTQIYTHVARERLKALHRRHHPRG